MVETFTMMPPSTARSSDMAPLIESFTGNMSDLSIPIANADLRGIMELWQPESAIIGMDIGVSDIVSFIGWPSSL